MKRKAYLDVSGLQPGGAGLPALADVAGKGGTLDLNGKSQFVEDLSAATAGALSKSGAGTVVLSDSANDYTAGTTITGGTLRFTGGIAGAAGPQPTTAPTSTDAPSPGKPESNRRFARATTASDSQVALGLAQRELSVADAKPGAKMDSGTDGLARDGRDKPTTTSLGLGFGNVTDFYDMAPRKGIKGVAANGRGEAAETLDRIATISGTEIAARRELGEKNADGPTAFPKTPATPMVTALGDKPVLSPDVVEFEGFINHGARIQPPAPGLPASGPASEATKFLTVNKIGATGQPGRPDDPTSGRVAFWTDDDTSKVKVNTASGLVSGPAQAPKTEHSKEATDFGTVSGVVAGSGPVTLD
ncbi:MAG: autotransporter-associated beta strand repeat-containing protein, partial [Chthoniobacteraceae bacterium]